MKAVDSNLARELGRLYDWRHKFWAMKSLFPYSRLQRLREEASLTAIRLSMRTG